MILLFLRVLCVLCGERLGFYLHAFPERNIARDVLRRRLGVRVLPRCILVDLPADRYIVIRGDALPAASGMRFARLQELPLDRIRGKVVVAFHHFTTVAIRDHLPVPDGSCHTSPVGLFAVPRPVE